MARFYKVVKDHPLWEVGAIISNADDYDRYKPISDMWQHTLDTGKELGDGWYEGAEVVENRKEFFVRVYKVSVLKQVKYLSKDAARKAHDELHKSK